ncbi:MAG: winged helix-turn-helix domain-containing protein [Candidatus Eremiobacteraeota bacterium]|nr:winged helix-turn-helix domain-containing protein [Candidatus Eremiobacteraeota bacterium]
MSVYEFGPFSLDAQRLLLLERTQPVPLGPKVVETLLALVEHPGNVLTKNALLDRIWPEGYVDEANLAQNVYVLRKTLRARWNVEAIETVPRRGYRFTMPVEHRDAMAMLNPSARVTTRRRSPWSVAFAASATLVLSAAGLTFALSPRSTSAQTALSPDGARLYEIGRYYWNLRTEGGVRKSIAYFARVVDTDPRNARGYAALASADAIMADYRFGSVSPNVYWDRAKAFARKALTIDSKSGEAYAVLGMIASTKSASNRDMLLGLNELQHAVSIDPTSGPAREWYGIALIERGRFNEAYDELRTAAELDPLSVSTTDWLSNAAYLEHRYGDSIAYARQTLDFSPQRSTVYESLGLSYEALGDRARALQAFSRLATDCAKCRPEAAALIAELYAHANRFAEARAELTIAEQDPKAVMPDDLALALAALGERATALTWLRRTKGPFLRAEIAADPRFAALRNDPRVAQIENPA